jgi:hypothetical protein
VRRTIALGGKPGLSGEATLFTPFHEKCLRGGHANDVHCTEKSGAATFIDSAKARIALRAALLSHRSQVEGLRMQ